MNPEMLESLMIDKALGQLAPEVSALLEAYLQQNPDAARANASLAHTVRLARAASAAAPAVSSVRPFDANRLRRAHDAVFPTSLRSAALRLAAAVAVGLGLGWLSREPRPSATELPAQRPALVAAPSTSSPPATGSFWSFSRIAAQQAAAPAPNPRRAAGSPHGLSPFQSHSSHEPF